MVVNNRGDLSNGLPPNEQLPDGDSELRPKHDLDRIAELKLIDAAQLGDMQALSHLFEHYRSDLYGFCLRRLNDSSLAEDVVQEVFIKALTRLPSFDRNKRIWPWFATIASRLCIDLQRRRSFTHYSGNIDISMDAGNGHTESALDSVITSEDRAELWKSLDVLPERQRRAFVLYEVDGLSCADIAAAEGISVGAVKLLLFRARKKIRSIHQARPLPAIVFPFTWLSWRLQRLGQRIRTVLDVSGERLSGLGVAAVSLSFIATTAMIASQPPGSSFNSDGPSSNNDLQRIRETSTVLAQSFSGRTAMKELGSSDTESFEKPSFLASNEKVANALVDSVIDPNRSATPENSSLYSIVVSPNYSEDHTIVAAGHYSKRHVLFISNDGGATWKPRVSTLPLFLYSNAIGIAPGYPQDRRVFVIGEGGFQRSDDGGVVFKAASPVLGTLAISPSFGITDSKILIGSTKLLDYDAELGVVTPSPLVLPLPNGGSFSSIAFSPAYPRDPTTFVSDNSGSTPTVHRCEGSICGVIHFPIAGAFNLLLSPQFDQDGLAYAYSRYANGKLLVSNDKARTFREVLSPFSNKGSIGEVAVWWNGISDPTVFVYGYGDRESAVYRSVDEGRSWSKASAVDFRILPYGVDEMTVTPTGRLLATSRTGTGIACSNDGGITWAPRCPPE